MFPILLLYDMIEHMCCTCSDSRSYSSQFMMIDNTLKVAVFSSLVSCNITRIRDEVISLAGCNIYGSNERSAEYFLHYILYNEFLFTDRLISALYICLQTD